MNKILIFILAVFCLAFTDIDKQDLERYKLLSNGGIENGLVGWVASVDGTKEVESTIIRSGKKSLKFTGDNTSAGEYVESIPSIILSDTNCNFYLYYLTASSDIEIRVFDNLNNPITAATALSVSPTFKKTPEIKFACTPPTKYKIRIIDTGLTQAPVYIDDVFLGDDASSSVLGGLTPTRIPFISGTGTLTDSADLTYDGTTINLTATDIELDGDVYAATIIGGVLAGDNLTLNSTSDVTKGSVLINESTTSIDLSSGALIVTGGVAINENLNIGGVLSLVGSGSGAVGFTAAAAAGSEVYTLPSVDGSPDKALVSDGSNILSWATLPQFSDNYSPTGFVDTSNITMSVAGNIFSLIAASDYSVYLSGVKHTYLAGTKTVNPLCTVVGEHYITLDVSTGNLVSSISPWDILAPTAVFVAMTYCTSATTSDFLEWEAHSSEKMSQVFHAYLHATRGTAWQSGLAITNGTTGTSNPGADNTLARVWYGTGSIWDEDIHISIQNSAGAGKFKQVLGSNLTIDPALIPIYYFDATGIFKKKIADEWPFAYTGINGPPQWDQVGVGLTDPPAGAPNTRYIPYWVFATNDYDEPVIAVPNNALYTSLALAQAASPGTLSWGSVPFQEMKLLHRIIWVTNSTWGNTHRCRIAEVVDYRNSSPLPAASFIGTDHNSLTNLQSGDVHTQYAYLNGRAGGQTLIGSIDASENLILESTAHVTKGQVIINESTTSTDKVSGALVCNGGVGIAENLNVGGIFKIQGSASGAFGLQVPAAAGAITYTLPITDGTNSNALKTDGSATLSWGADQGIMIGNGSHGTPISVVIATGVAFTGTNSRNLWWVKSATAGGADITANPQIAAGGVANQELILIGTSDVDWLGLQDGTGLSLNGPMVLNNYSSITLVWDIDSSLWVETGRRE